MSLLLALLAAAVQPAPAEPARLEFRAGRATRGRWRMEAFVQVEFADPPPIIGGFRCAIAGPGLSIVYSDRGTDFALGGAGYGYRTADITGFEIGGVSYEAQRWVEPAGEARFSDVHYPPGFDATPGRPSPRATILAVRHRPDEPWLSHVTLVDDIIAVPQITIRYRHGEGERSARLSTAGFGDALRWCDERRHSAHARRLPERLRRILIR